MKRKKLEASVTTVVPLSPDEQKILTEWIKDKFGEEVGEIKFSIDKKILGGIIIQVGDQIIDKSFAYLLTELSERLTI